MTIINASKADGFFELLIFLFKALVRFALEILPKGPSSQWGWESWLWLLSLFVIIILVIWLSVRWAMNRESQQE